MASIAAVGEINLNATREQWPAVIKMLRKLSPVLPGMDLTTSSLSSLMAVEDSGDAPNIFGYMHCTGVLAFAWVEEPVASRYALSVFAGC